MWVLDYLGDVCMDLSRFHGVVNAAHMDSASFFAAAARLVAYEGGSVRRRWLAETERRNAAPPDRVATLAELTGRADAQPRDGWAPVFEVTRVPRATA